MSSKHQEVIDCKGFHYIYNHVRLSNHFFPFKCYWYKHSRDDYINISTGTAIKARCKILLFSFIFSFILKIRVTVDSHGMRCRYTRMAISSQAFMQSIDMLAITFRVILANANETFGSRTSQDLLIS